MLDDNTRWAWVAGLMEGEATFGFYQGRYPNGRKYVVRQVVVEMNDRDVIDRLHAIAGVGKVRVKAPRRNLHETYVWAVYSKADISFVLNKILPYMGERRTAKIMEVLDRC